MLVAALAFLVGITGLANMTSAALVSWGALFAVSFILFAAFGGFKPFFAGDRNGMADGVADESGLANLEGQDQAISRHLVTVGADDEADGRPLFEDRSPVVSQPEPAVDPRFDDASRVIANPESPSSPPAFGDALRERLADDKEESRPANAPSEEEEAGVETPVAEGDLADKPQRPPTLVTEAAPWVAARNEAEHNRSTTPHIEVEESPSWMRPADDAATPDLDSAGPAGGSEDGDVEDSDTAETDVAETEDTETEVDTAESEAGVTETEGSDTADTDTDFDTSIAANSLATNDLALDEGSSERLPVVVSRPAPLELHKYSPGEIMAVVRTQESELVDTLIDEGVLTTSGPITDRDVRTMLFVAVSSNELIDVLTAASGDGNTASGDGNTAGASVQLNA